MGTTSSAAHSPLPVSLQAYQLYVEIEDVSPKVWRRFLVPTTIGLSLLHVTLLWGTGWQGGHVHEFVFGDDNYGAKESGLDFPNVMDEEKVTLRQALGTRKTFVYVYDFGDNWRHKVKVEKVVELDAPISHGVCIGGENACPPEDVGGAPGYEEFLEALADPDHYEHQHLKDWIGASFNPAAFDVAEANQRLIPEVL
jgi:hypothetical protein